VDEARIRAALPAKLEAKGLALEAVSAERLLSRKPEFLADWTNNLIPLVQPAGLPDFDQAWEETTAFLGNLLRQ
jgi:hypothetical protein